MLLILSAVVPLLFLFSSALTGLELSSILLYYSQNAIGCTFWVATGMFLFGSIVGFFIKGDMSGVGRFLTLTLLGGCLDGSLRGSFPGRRG